MAVTTGSKARRPFLTWVLIILMLVLGIGAVVSGPMLFLAPDGSLMQLPMEELAGTPFSDYLIPGIILFVCNGLFPLFVVIGLVWRPAWRWPDAINPFKNYHWSWTASLAAGVILLIWIITETVMMGYISFLQPVMGAWGMLIVGLTVLPPVQRTYRR